MTDIYTFDDTVAGEKVTGFAVFHDGPVWSKIPEEGIGWINILMQDNNIYDTTASSVPMDTDSVHEIIKLVLPDMSDDEVIKENYGKTTEYMGSVDYHLNAKVNSAIYKYNTDFDGIDEAGNLVKAHDEKITVHQIADFISHPNAAACANDLKINKLVASVSSYDSNIKLGDTVVVYDLNMGTAAFYRDFTKFVNDLIGESIIYAGQLLIDEPSGNIKDDAIEYIKMISVELFS